MSKLRSVGSKIWENGVALLVGVLVFYSTTMFVLKVLGIIDWPWWTVVVPVILVHTGLVASGVLVVIVLWAHSKVVHERNESM